MYVILDARKMGTKEEAHTYLQQIFSFPDYYGRNLDALYDCLSEIRSLSVYILHAGEAGEYFEKVLSVFEDLECAKLIVND